jgi:hypothetical protein
MASVAQPRKQRRRHHAGAEGRLHRFTVRQYEQLTACGVLGARDHVELLDGLVVENVDIMTQHPPHMVSICCTRDAVAPLLPPPWIIWEQKAVRLSTSEPEPDVGVIQGPARRYSTRHPTAADVGLLIEVADSSVDYDRDVKGPIYARARIPHYWIVNIPERRLETYSEPKGGKAAGYRQRRDYGPDDLVPLLLADREVGQIPVRDLLP